MAKTQRKKALLKKKPFMLKSVDHVDSINSKKKICYMPGHKEVQFSSMPEFPQKQFPQNFHSPFGQVEGKTQWSDSKIHYRTRDVASVSHRQKCKHSRWVCWAKAIAFQRSRVFSPPSGYYLHPCGHQLLCTLICTLNLTICRFYRLLINEVESYK